MDTLFKSRYLSGIKVLFALAVLISFNVNAQSPYLDNNTLYILGTDGPDEIQVSSVGNQWKVQVEFHSIDFSQELSFDQSQVNKVVVKACGGDDDVQMNGTSSEEIPFYLYGDDGNDQLQGGDMQDTIFGGRGNDEIQGHDGNDTLIGGDGLDSIQGGNGSNLIQQDGSNGTGTDLCAFNLAPEAIEGVYFVDEDFPLTINLEASDPNSDPLTYTIQTIPQHGILTGTGDQRIYQANAGFVGTDSFTFTANDGSQDSNVATVSINVRDITLPNITPIIAPLPNQVGWNNSDVTLSFDCVDGWSGIQSCTAPINILTEGANQNFIGEAVDQVGNTSTTTVTINLDKTIPSLIVTSPVDGSILSSPTVQITGTASDAISTVKVAVNGVNAPLDTTGQFNLPVTLVEGLNTMTIVAEDQAGNKQTVSKKVTLQSNQLPVAQEQSVSLNEDGSLNLLLTATDANGDQLVYSVVNQPLNGALSGTLPNLVYQPTTNYFGSDSFTFKANDGTGDSNLATVTIQVVAVNDAPVMQNQNLSTDEDNVLAINLIATDIENDALSFVVLQQPINGVLSGTASNLSYQPNTNFNGADSFTVKANDGTADSNIATYSITVNGVNDIPVAAGQSISTDEDTVLNIALTGSDSDNDLLSYVVATQPAHGVLTGVAPNLVYTPSANYHGSDSFIYYVNDGLSDSSAATVAITVNSINDLPLADNQNIIIDEDAATSIILTGSDNDGDALTYQIVSQPSHGTVTGTVPNLNYTPNTDYSGIDSFTFTVSDGSALSVTATITITINAVNDAPVAYDQSVVTDEDIASLISLQGIDPEGDDLSYTVVATPLNGTLTGTGPNLTFIPNPNFYGSDSLTFEINDGSLNSGLATVSITINAVNDAPVADAVSIITDEDQTLSIVLSGSDVDGDPINYMVVTQPGSGVLTGVAPNLTYTPYADFNGTDSFTYEVNDGLLSSTPETVSITVQPVNDAPIAESQTISVDENSSVAINLVASDVDHDTLNWTVISEPVNGSISGTLPAITYTPNTDYFGSDTFTYQVSDGVLFADLVVTVTVNEVADPLTFNSNPIVFGLLNELYTYEPVVTGGTESVTRFSLSVHPAGMNIDPVTGIIQWTPDLVGVYPVEITILNGVEEVTQAYDLHILNPEASHSGNDFWLTFSKISTTVTGQYILNFTAEKDASGYIEIPALSFNYPVTLSAGIVTSFDINNLVLSATGSNLVPGTGIHVNVNQPVSIYALNYVDKGPDGYLALPTEALGKEYILASYTMGLSGYTSVSQVDIIAPTDNTTVQVEFFKPYYINSIEHPPGTDTIVLNAGESAHYAMDSRSKVDAINTAIVTSDKPVAVFSGSECTGLPVGGYNACDHLVEQLPPVDQLSTVYATVPFALREKGDTFRVFAAKNGTVLRRNGTPIVTLNRGQYWENRINEASILSANHPIQVVQYQNSQSFDLPYSRETDPSMLVLVPESQYLKSYRFVSGTAAFHTHFINVVIPQAGLSTLTLDGVNLDTNAFIPIQDSGLWGGQVELTAGYHEIDSSEAFGLTIYGYQNYGSYAYQGGMKLGRIPETAQLVLTVDQNELDLGQTACLIATVENNGVPVINARVDFQVTGKNSDEAYLFTDTNGQTQFCYQALDPGLDTVEATLKGQSQIDQINWLWDPVGSGDHSPVILSLPESNTLSNQLYQYQVVAIDGDLGDMLTYQLVSQPMGMMISHSGIITWTPDETQLGTHNISIQVTDSVGHETIQDYILTVSQANRAPVVLSQPANLIAYVDRVVRHPVVEIADPDGDFFYINPLSGPSWFYFSVPGYSSSVNPSISDVGNHVIKYQIIDIEGNVTDIEFNVTVKENHPPELVIEPLNYAKVGNLYSTQLQFLDPDGDALEYVRTWIPSGDFNVNSSTGEISWIPTENDIGTHDVLIEVSDVVDKVNYRYPLTVYPEDQPFELSLDITPSVIAQGEPATIDLNVIGAVGSVSYSVTVNGIEQTVNDNQVVFTDTTYMGVYTIVATAANGPLVSEVTQTFRVSDPSDTTGPSVTIHSPIPGTSITAPTEVIASVQDTTLTNYELRIAPSNSPDQYQVLTSGNTEVLNASVGQIDPTLMMNGLYQLSLVATDASGAKSTVLQEVVIEGDLKVGNFTYTVEDLNIPMSGIPITVSRTYDSRRKHENLDFGHGWSLSYQNVKIEESRLPGLGWNLNEYPAGIWGIETRWCVEPQGAPVVTITLPDGDVEKFEVVADPQCNQLVAVTDVNLAFNAVGDTQSTLELQNPKLLRLNGNELIEIGTGNVHDPDLYILTTRSGYKYYLDQQVGVQKVIDPNGNTITYSDAGIFHSDGTSITFNRDNEGHIIRIRDTMGRYHNYNYTVVGDLDRVTDINGMVGSYDYNYRHGLTRIVDALGRDVIRNIYDDTGRLIAQEDGAGNRTDFVHDIVGRQSTITDKLGNITFYYYDDRGNVTSTVDALGGVTSYTYDANGNQLTVTDANGHTSTATYNSNNDQLTQTNALGHTTTYTYNQRGQELTVTDAKGNVFTNTYDTVGNLLSIEDPLGNVSGNNINAKGLPVMVQNALGHQTTYTYDTQGNKLTETDALGNIITRTYTSMNKLSTETVQRTVNGVLTAEKSTHDYDQRDQNKSIRDPSNGLLSWEYDLAGNKVSERDQNNNTTIFEYDAYKRLILTTYADSSTASKSYDVEGNLTSETDRNGYITTYTYDALNRQIRVDYPDGSNRQTEYDAVGNVTAEIDENGNRTEYEYDEANRRILMRDAENNETSFVYDANDNLISQTDASLRTTQYEYDVLDRRTKTIYPDASFNLTEYDALGQVISKTDQNGLTTQYEYDPLGRLITVTDALNQLTSYTYDEVGNKLTQTDAEGRTTTWTYDAMGRELSRTLPLGQQETKSYDPAGNLTNSTDFNGKQTQYSFDSNQRLVLIRYFGGDYTQEDHLNDLGNIRIQESFIYDFNGNRVNATNRAGQERIWEYDSRNRLVLDTKENGETIEYGYDNTGNRTALTVTPSAGAGTTTHFGFDALNRLISVTDANNQVTSYTYDNVGNRESVSYPNGNTTDYFYDDLNRLTRLTTTDASSNVLVDFQYTLDASGHRTQILENSGRVTDYVYDDLYRLTDETITDVVNGNYSANYQYDAVGNRTYSTINGVSTAYTYDDNDRLTQQGGETYSYDDNGNTISKTIDGETSTYSYDVKGQLNQARLIEGGVTIDTRYRYDVDGIRISKTENGNATNYLVDHNRDYAQVLKETDQSLSQTLDYLYGDDLINQSQNNANEKYYLYDGLGSTRALSDSTGVTTDTYDYDAFGDTLNRTGSTSNDYLFTGEQYDQGLKQQYLRARYYDPHTARFTQQDTFSGWESDPVSFQKYIYANANPVNNTDPTGQFSIGSLMTTVGNVARLATTAVSNVGRGLISRARFVAGRAPTTNAVRWGFWRDLPKKVIGGVRYASIGGRAFTREAVNRMVPRAFGTAAGGQAGRGITPTIVAHVIRFGKLLGRYQKVINARGGNGYIREIYELNGIRVVTEANNRIVITVVKLLQ